MVNGNLASRQGKRDVAKGINVEKNSGNVKPERARQFSLRQANDASSNSAAGTFLVKKGLAKAHAGNLRIDKTNIDRRRVIRFYLK